MVDRVRNAKMKLFNLSLDLLFPHMLTAFAPLRISSNSLLSRSLVVISVFHFHIHISLYISVPRVIE